ncbi:MAG: indolepyruvate oxidoreductase subunit beta [Bacteroidales bacterium]|nr:indolepyruvate oxidoreductase subunit beta [Bacteroidales bacterium]
MKKDIILCGVGGQGILSIATVIGEAATVAGFHLKQSEVHGMSQRGGSVESHLRLSDAPLYSDLIPRGKVDLIIAMEPMEALRYAGYLDEGGVIVTSSTPLINIPDYPCVDDVISALDRYPRVLRRELEGRSANMELLGMAAPYIEILSVDQLYDAIGRVFSRKGEAVVRSNQEAFLKK